MAAPSIRRRPPLVAVLPLLWLGMFLCVPVLIVVKISLSQTAIAQPPYVPVLDLGAGWAGLKAFVAGLSLDSFVTLFSDPLYAGALWKSIEVAGLSTAILVLIGYPLAYGMARAPRRWRGVLLVLVILPFWTAFLIRTYAWMTILQHDGLLNGLLLALGVVDAPVVWLATDTAVLIGIVYAYLPFMVLPLFATLESIAPVLTEAAADLGAPPAHAFWRVTLPLSRPGVMAGALLCFIPIMGEFVIPDLLGSSTTAMLGQVLWTEFFSNRDWPVASAVAVLLLVVMIAPVVIHQRQRPRMPEKA